MIVQYTSIYRALYYPIRSLGNMAPTLRHDPSQACLEDQPAGSSNPWFACHPTALLQT